MSKFIWESQRKHHPESTGLSRELKKKNPKKQFRKEWVASIKTVVNQCEREHDSLRELYKVCLVAVWSLRLGMSEDSEFKEKQAVGNNQKSWYQGDYCRLALGMLLHLPGSTQCWKMIRRKSI